MDTEIINNIKVLAIDMINEAKKGHPGIALSSAPIIYTLFSRHLNINTNDLTWINRDRFIMSAGHGSALLYATLYMAGYPITLDDLKDFRKLDSKTPGHPEYGKTPGVECSTGPLGQGLATAVGMALANKIVQSRFYLKEKGRFGKVLREEILDHNIYVLCGDGDLMEGISYEAASFAGNLRLNNLIVLYDSNHMSMDGNTNMTFTENVLERFKALGWDTSIVNNGNDVEAISKAIERAKHEPKPSIIEIKTKLGDGLLKEGTKEVHSGPVSGEDAAVLKQKLGWNLTPFTVSERARNNFISQINSHSSKKYQEWADEYRRYVNEVLDGDNSAFNFLINKDNEININLDNWVIRDDEKLSTVESNKKLIDNIAKMMPNFIGGSADVNASTNTYISNGEDITINNYNARNIFFGVREHAMGAILNGLALEKFRVFGSTFLAFSDYLKPSIRMSSLMKLPVTYIFTNDSIEIGTDGPTHQPIEQLALLRATPNLNVFRPADFYETVGCWKYILSNKTTPNALVLSKTPINVFNKDSVDLVSKGAYIVRKEKNLHGIIIATGREVSIARRIAEQLYNESKLDIRVVSMPCQELFMMQDETYRNEILPKDVRTIVIEPSSSLSWYQFVYSKKFLLTLDEFGVSGKPTDVLKHFNYDFESLKKRVKDLL